MSVTPSKSTPPSAPQQVTITRHLLGGPASAIGFLTIVPVPRVLLPDAFDLGPALPWFPLVGVGVGAIGGGVRVGLQPSLGHTVATVLAVAAMVIVTGALHVDALADSFDALGARGDRTRRLEVMHDSRVGSFGVLAIVFWALTLVAALAGMTELHALRALIAAGAAGRFAAVLHGRLTAPARPGGLGAALGATTGRVVAAALLTVVVCFLALSAIAAAIVGAVALACALLGTLGARWLVGGRNGDTLGATILLTELVSCLLMLGYWR